MMDNDIKNNGKNKNKDIILDGDMDSINETLYFYSIPGYVDEINRIRETEDWDNCSIYKIEDE